MKLWTARETEIAISLRKAGFTTVQIAEKLGRSKSSVGRRLQRCNNAIPVWYWAPEEDADLRRRVEAGEKDRDMAKVFNRTEGSIKNRRVFLGLGRQVASRKKIEDMKFKEPVSLWPTDMPDFDSVPPAELARRDWGRIGRRCIGPWPV